MNTQNILKFYGSRLDLKLDSSEFYDYELGKNEIDFDTEVIDFDSFITYTGLTINSNCITGTTLDVIKPWVIEINKDYTGYTCDFNVRRRTEKGWTLDFVFNKETLPWVSGSTFYYWGISGETNEDYFVDNNLSFSFTTDGRIKWESYRYSGYCDNTSGFTESYYISTGQTPVLCSNGTSEDFNITIVFDRNRRYTNCDLENEGGWNDLILGPYPISYTGNTGSTTTQIITGYTIITELTDYITGGTGTTQYTERISSKWLNERDKRLGTLKIYLNGRPIYKLKNWEEIIPSVRESTNPIVQIWGGGTNGYLDLHTGNTEFTLYQIKYFEEPLDFVHVRHHHITEIINNFSIVDCVSDCVDNVILYTDTGVILTENEQDIVTEDLNLLIF